ncbi:hypothetical protein CAPTEDRAFT_124963 [Capitella teleta]|uniref:F5/8 type C domain-containing protein n=1 Tax=Capitella teleta TaxID=283909 RepID=R7UMG8_CAPTE|nr:hypothetical protein CAPTEDRAFT_124963 [Capitella teleta]|eukprot:ELU07425.1 hypothetical protein CAPTEDRAFT_124963 [Capitella teleta]
MDDKRLTASSQYNSNPWCDRGRIDTVLEGPLKGAWCSGFALPGEWIQVEFDAPMTVQAIQTRGRSDYNQWVDSYTLHFSEDGTNWEPYQEPYGTVKIFSGNFDSNTTIEHSLHAPMRAKYARVVAESFTTNNIALRFELFGCHYSGE